MNINDVLITIQSSRREFQVETINKMVEPFVPVWFVPIDEVDNYKKFTEHVVGVVGERPMKPIQENKAIELGFEDNQFKVVVTMDDDLKSMKEAYLTDDGKKRARPIDFKTAIERMYNSLVNSDYMVCGVTSSTNPFYSNLKVNTYGMIFGGFMMHKEGGLKFDERLKANEDMEFVMANHVHFGGLLRDNTLLMEFEMEGRTKKPMDGGYQGLRKEENYYESLDIIIEKYKDNDAINVSRVPVGEPTYKKTNFRKINKEFLEERAKCIGGQF